MAMDADQSDMFQTADQVQYLSELAQVDAEFVFFHAGRDLGMRMCVYFRIDTEGDRGYFILGGSQFIQNLKFGSRFYVKAENIVVQSQVDFPVCFAYTGVNDFAGGETRIECRLYFATAHTVSTQAVFCDNRQDTRIGVSLDCIVGMIAILSGFCFYRVERFF